MRGAQLGGGRVGGPSVRSAHLLQNMPERKIERERSNTLQLMRLSQELLSIEETEPGDRVCVCGGGVQLGLGGQEEMKNLTGSWFVCTAFKAAASFHFHTSG